MFHFLILSLDGVPSDYFNEKKCLGSTEVEKHCLNLQNRNMVS